MWIRTSLDQELDNIPKQVYGWGRIEYGGEQSIDLLEVNVPVSSKEKCKQFLKQSIGVTMHEGQICAGGVKGKDACQVKLL